MYITWLTGVVLCPFNELTLLVVTMRWVTFVLNLNCILSSYSLFIVTWPVRTLTSTDFCNYQSYGHDRNLNYLQNWLSYILILSRLSNDNFRIIRNFFDLLTSSDLDLGSRSLKINSIGPSIMFNHSRLFHKDLISNFLSNPVNRQTDKQTNRWTIRHKWKHNFLPGGN